MKIDTICVLKPGVYSSRLQCVYNVTLSAYKSVCIKSHPKASSCKTVQKT